MLTAKPFTSAVLLGNMVKPDGEIMDAAVSAVELVIKEEYPTQMSDFEVTRQDTVGEISIDAGESDVKIVAPEVLDRIETKFQELTDADVYLEFDFKGTGYTSDETFIFVREN